jgi:hypothetical protein
MEANKKHQHYVWKKYLKPWTTDGKLWCKRKGVVFNPSLENIAQEKYFYAANPLNEIEIKIATEFIKRTPCENHPLLIKMLAQYIYIGNGPSDYLRKNAIENYHERIEHSGDAALELLYKKDLSFLNDADTRNNFFYFVSLQYHRTKGMFERAVTGLNNLPVSPPKEIEGQFDNENIIRVYSLLFAESLANWMAEKAKIYFIETDNEFIATDQPIINIHSNDKITFEPVREMEFYYPITPHLALFITAKDFKSKKINKSETDDYNNILYKKSYEQIYAYSKEILNSFHKSSNMVD